MFVVGGNNITVTLGNKDPIRLSPNQITMLKNNDRSIVVHKNGEEMELPASIFNENEHVEISIEKLPDVPGSLSRTFSFTTKQGGNILSKFKDGVTLSFEVDTARAKNPNNLKVFYLNENTEEWKLIGGTYKNGFVTVTTNHFSIFIYSVRV